MSHLFSCHSIAKAFGAQTLFTDLSLTVNSGDRIGLIGPNGSGKSTLLKIICSQEHEDAGTILARKHMVVSYLAQEDRFRDELGPEENLLEALKEAPLEESEKLNRVQTLLSRARMTGMNLPVGRLSGGWRKRLSICRALVVEPDLLVMDEPTNHLDIEGIVWLEELLAGVLSTRLEAYIMVSHDRRFLENCTNRIIELSKAYSSGSFQVDGSYSTFLERRSDFLDQQNQLEDKLANKVRRETEWLRRGPKARTSKARFRIDEAYRLQDELAQVKRQNRADRSVSLDFTATGRKTKKLLEGKNLSKGFGGKPLFTGLDIVLSPGTRIGLVGQNGCGKSTLMHILASAATGGFKPDSGTIKTADNVSIVTFTQDRSAIDPELSLRRTLAPEGDGVVFQGRSVHVVSWAKRFLFRPDQLETPVGRLSGGEQARIFIADLMRRPADILLLDEPTNDLDIPSLDVLEESLLEFSGALVLVTHDRYLLDRVCDRVLGFTGGGELNYYGDYEQWWRDIPEDERNDNTKKTVDSKIKQTQKPKTKGRLSYLDQREYDTIEDRIATAEENCGRLEQLIEDPALAAEPARLQAVWCELEQARVEVEGLYERWAELEDKKTEGF